jgi:hypothetical protein
MNTAQYWSLIGIIITSVGLLIGTLKSEFKSLNARIDGLTARMANVEIEIHAIQSVLMQTPTPRTGGPPR